MLALVVQLQIWLLQLHLLYFADLYRILHVVIVPSVQLPGDGASDTLQSGQQVPALLDCLVIRLDELVHLHVLVRAGLRS